MIKLSKRKSVYLIFAFVLCGVILVYIYNNPSNPNEIGYKGYERYEEARIKDLIETLEGVSDASVLLSFESNEELKVSLSEADPGFSPKIKGIAISVVGGDDPVISEKIKSLICAAYDINERFVFVCGK